MRAFENRGMVLALLFIAATGVSAEVTWELPEGVEVGNVVPALLPQGSVGPITFEEDEFPYDTVIDGLVVTTLNGDPLPAPLTFGFSSLDAIVNGGPGDITYVQEPNIEGDSAGTLSIDFGGATTSLTFGFALACAGPIEDGATAQALDTQNNPVGSPVSVEGLNLGAGFAENQLTLAPGGTFRSVEISFDPGADCGRFALDNLAYDGQPVPAMPAVPLGMLVLMLAGGGLLALSLRRF